MEINKLETKEDLINRINFMCDEMKKITIIEDKFLKKEQYNNVRNQIDEDLKVIKDSGMSNNIINTYKYGLNEFLHYLKKANGNKINDQKVIEARGKLQSSKYA